ncbi:hypothetical protein ACCY75_01255 [Enterobacter kobei]|uniref:hypothetical protein n=1 Tax=Enterobacter kobei TaxID=208224 RepID=UPI003EDA1003
MSNIDKRAQKELYAKVEHQAHFLRGSPGEYQALTGLCPVNVIEMHAQKIQALLDELEAKDKRIAELEDIAKSVKFDPIPMEDLGNKSDGKKHPYMFGAGYNSAVVHCESVLLQAFAAAAGKGEAS